MKRRNTPPKPYLPLQTRTRHRRSHIRYRVLCQWVFISGGLCRVALLARLDGRQCKLLSAHVCFCITATQALQALSNNEDTELRSRCENDRHLLLDSVCVVVCVCVCVCVCTSNFQHKLFLVFNRVLRCVKQYREYGDASPPAGCNSSTR
jgi:hypothetical protein